MKICLVGFDNLPLLAPEYRAHLIGGEAVQQTLLGRALAQRGHDVSMVVADCGQDDGGRWEAIRVFKAYRLDAGVPGVRFIHPRWTGMWSALKRADADLYYTSCAGMQVGLVALFCRRHRRRFVFRVASDSDCDASRLLVPFARDRWLYAYGVRRADAILVQSTSQAEALARNYGLASRLAGMMVERPLPTAERDIDVLWVGNIRREKRPDRILELADGMPEVKIHMVGGPLRDEEAFFGNVESAARARPNVVFHGRLTYWDANALYGRSRLLLNTSDVEGFPNSYLQAWIRGVPVVALIDPDRVIEREGLGAAARSAAALRDAVRSLLDDPAAWQAASERCRAYVAREHCDDKVLAAYLDTFEKVIRAPDGGKPMIASRAARHV
ncbi:MAG TPA: glycosyltransferase family 4 protein [Burkholderiales bacterium]|nr:glycosyltransferase family 4 protein [Burkholderiales bacterium]